MIGCSGEIFYAGSHRYHALLPGRHRAVGPRARGATPSTTLQPILRVRLTVPSKFSNFCIVRDETDGLACAPRASLGSSEYTNLENRPHIFIGRTK